MSARRGNMMIYSRYASTRKGTTRFYCNVMPQKGWELLSRANHSIVAIHPRPSLVSLFHLFELVIQFERCRTLCKDLVHLKALIWFPSRNKIPQSHDHRQGKPCGVIPRLSGSESNALHLHTQPPPDAATCPIESLPTHYLLFAVNFCFG